MVEGKTLFIAQKSCIESRVAIEHNQGKSQHNQDRIQKKKVFPRNMRSRGWSISAQAHVHKGVIKHMSPLDVLRSSAQGFTQADTPSFTTPGFFSFFLSVFVLDLPGDATSVNSKINKKIHQKSIISKHQKHYKELIIKGKLDLSTHYVARELANTLFDRLTCLKTTLT